MATEGNFTDLGTYADSDSELGKVPVASYRRKPSKYNMATHKVAQLVVEPLVKIDDALFKKILFFMIYYPTDLGLGLFLQPPQQINPHILFKMPFAEETLFKITTQNRDYGFINNMLTGFVETIIVFYYYLNTTNFYRNTETSGDKYNFFNCKTFDEKSKSGRSNDAYQGWDFIFNKDDNTEIDITLGRLIYDKDATRKNMYNKINFISDNGIDVSPTIDISTTHKELDTLRNYVELLEKLIDETIKIELKDGELFANKTQIRFKKDSKNRLNKLCRYLFEREEPIHIEDSDTKLYDTILSVYSNQMFRARYGDLKLCGGRNNKTQKRHRNKASHKKMRKSHNIRKRKATGKKRK